ncbi:MAG: hypothetical protein SPL21_10055 [Fibrobacter sp.]|nr:hypothetical protein [Fibrobacter sp.]
MSELKAGVLVTLHGEGMSFQKGSDVISVTESETEFYLKAEADKFIAELKKRSQWHRQKDKDIYFECGNHWGAEYIIKMKDGTTHLAYGGCDEGGDGSVSTYFHFQDEDYEWDYDDIDIWYEIPDHKIIGNIKEA